MGKKSKNGEIQTVLRIPANLHKALKKATESTRRSLNSEMVFRLAESLQKEKELV